MQHFIVIDPDMMIINTSKGKRKFLKYCKGKIFHVKKKIPQVKGL